MKQKLIFQIINPHSLGINPLDNINAIILDEYDNQIGNSILLNDLIKIGQIGVRNTKIAKISTLSNSKILSTLPNSKIHNHIEYWLKIPGPIQNAGKERLSIDSIYKVYDEDAETHEITITPWINVNYMELITNSNYLPNTFQKIK